MVFNIYKSTVDLLPTSTNPFSHTSINYKLIHIWLFNIYGNNYELKLFNTLGTFLIFVEYIYKYEIDL